MNITRSDTSILIVLNVAATICMSLRLRQFTEKKKMNFNFPPLTNQNWPTNKRKRFDDMDEIEALDTIIYTIDAEQSESNKAEPRTSLLMRHITDDDEGICDYLASKYLDETCKADKKFLKIYKRKIGRTFAACLDFIRRNNLRCKIFSKQTNPVTNIPYYYLTNTTNQFPNYRISMFTSLGHYESKSDEDEMDKARTSVFSTIYSEEQETFEVRFSFP